MAPQLRRLEQRYPAELVVIGVHAAKFPSEKETDTIRWAMLRHAIEHPVVNDRDFTIWRSYAVRAWPTLVFIDPRGKVIGSHAGELPFEALDSLIGEMITEFETIGLLDRTPIAFAPDAVPTGPLAFPTKIVVDGDRILIADTGHHRIVITNRAGRIQRTIGGSEAGNVDGDLASARFDRPHGMAVAGDIIYVADTENHTIRRIDFAGGTVTTVGGTGEIAQGFGIGGQALETAIRSPWDLVLVDGRLFIAMAGSHQVWAFDPEPGYLYPWAGAGPEAIQDGSLQTALLAQPSGISYDGQVLVIADSETSAIRRVDLDEGGDVTTYVGTDLFDFGDVDGVGEEVKLQHPIGVFAERGAIFIADSFNHKIKRLDPGTRACVTIAGTGEAGEADGPAREATFHEPSGLWLDGGVLYVADTNSHAIRLLDLASGTVRTLAIHEESP